MTLRRRACVLAVTGVAAGVLVACGSTTSTPVGLVSPATFVTNTAPRSPCATKPAITAPAPSPSTGVRHLVLDVPAVVVAHHQFVVGVDVNYLIHIQAPTGALLPGTGHFHLFIDRPPFPVGARVPDIGLPGIIHTITKRTLIPGLDPGTHTITATLANGLDETSGDVPAVSAVVVAC